MTAAYLYALALLLIIPFLMEWQPLGIFGLVMGSLLAWLIIWLFKEGATCREQDEEYIGTYVLEARYFTEWTERVRHEDKKTKKVTYETVHHPEDWEVTVAEGRRTVRISHTTYNRYVDAFGNEHEANADHQYEARGTILDPGTCYYTQWPGTYVTACYRYITREYDNPTLRAPNLFQTEDLSEEDVKKYKLWEYCKREIYGSVKGDDVDALEKEAEDYNCWFRTKQIKLNFILLENADTRLALYWQQYWKNGKRNTVNAVIGVDGKHKIKWVHVFGWQNEGVRVKLRDLLVGCSDINDIVAHFEEIKNLLETEYHRADFKQYDYIRRRFPLKGALITLTIFLGLFCGFFCREPYPPMDAMRFIAKKDLQSAKKILEPYIGTAPKDSYSYSNLGMIYFTEGKHEEALRMLNYAIAHQEGYDAVEIMYHNRSEVYKKLGNYKAALKDAQKVLELVEYPSELYLCNLESIYETLGYKNSLRRLKERLSGYVNFAQMDCTQADAVKPYISKDVDDVYYGRFPLVKKIFS